MEGMDDTPHSDSDAYDEDEDNESSDDETTNDADQTIDELIVRELNSNASLRFYGMTIQFLWYWLMTILIGFTIGHSLYWFILVLIGLCIYCIDAVQNSRWTYDHRFRVHLGHTQPWPVDYTVALNQGVNHVAQTSDSLQPITIIVIFSTTITEHFPFDHESTAEENTEPHDMFPIILNTMDQDRQPIENENTLMNMNETTQNDLHDTILLPESTISALVMGDGITETSVEISNINSSVNSRELDNVGDSNSSNDDNHVILNNNQTGETLSQMVTISTDSSTLQISQSIRGVDNPTEDDSLRILSNTNSMIINQIKIPTPATSSDESGEETDV